MSTPTAIAAALGAALTLGVSAVADQRSTKRVQTRKAFSPRILADLVRQPLWLTAIGANIAGFALQVVALDAGSIAVVQPILVGDLVFAVLISTYLARRTNSERPPARWVFTGVAATTAGIAGFLVIGQPSAGNAQVDPGIEAPLVIALMLAATGCLAVLTKDHDLKPLALALACGVCYGAAAFAIKLVTGEFGGGPAQVFTSWPIYFFAIAGPAGFILNQDAFQQGTFLSPVQAIITAADPVISIALGIAFLGVRLRGGPAATAGEVAALLIMVAGIVITARHAPQTASRAPAGSPAVAGQEPAG